jgi:hypothetical protein
VKVFGDWTGCAAADTQVAELRIELESRGLPSSGLKAELVKRLQANWAEAAGASASTTPPSMPATWSPRSHPPGATYEATPQEDSRPLSADEEHEEALADAALDYEMSRAPQSHERAREDQVDTGAQPRRRAGQDTEVDRVRRQLLQAQFRANKTAFGNATGLELMFLVRRTSLPAAASAPHPTVVISDVLGTLPADRRASRRRPRSCVRFTIGRVAALQEQQEPAKVLKQQSAGAGLGMGWGVVWSRARRRDRRPTVAT